MYLIKDMRQEMGDENIPMYTGDYPANQNFADSMAVVDKAPLSALQKQGILGQNLANLLTLS